MGGIGGPPINKAARGAVDLIPLSSSSRRSHFHCRRFPAAVALLRSCDRLVPPRTRASSHQLRSTTR
jgi:hypothetical protein